MKFGDVKTSCIVEKLEDKNPQVKTGLDLNLGLKGPRTLQSSVTYQLYGPAKPSGLAVGTDMKARIEAIAVTELRS